MTFTATVVAVRVGAIVSATSSHASTSRILSLESSSAPKTASASVVVAISGIISRFLLLLISLCISHGFCSNSRNKLSWFELFLILGRDDNQGINGGAKLIWNGGNDGIVEYIIVNINTSGKKT